MLSENLAKIFSIGKLGGEMGYLITGRFITQFILYLILELIS